MTDRGHEWVEVKNRRWCLTCSAFQRRTHEGTAWEPRMQPACEWDSVYAQRKLAGDPTTQPRMPEMCNHYVCRCVRAEQLARMSDERGRSLEEKQRLFADAVAVHSKGLAVPCVQARRLRLGVTRDDLPPED